MEHPPLIVASLRPHSWLPHDARTGRRGQHPCHQALLNGACLRHMSPSSPLAQQRDSENLGLAAEGRNPPRLHAIRRRKGLRASRRQAVDGIYFLCRNYLWQKCHIGKEITVLSSENPVCIFFDLAREAIALS